MRILNKIFIALVLTLIIVGMGCHNESNPAVPGAPESDVIKIVQRNPEIRVGLLSFTPQKNIYVSSSAGQFKVYVGDGMMEFASGISGETVKFTGEEDMITYTAAGEDDAVDLNNKEARIEMAEYVDGAYLMVGTSKSDLRPYRGTIRLILEGKNVLVVNSLPLEDYLLGVVPAEMDPSWHKEALKAQAVVSRSYAVFNIERYDKRGFDVADDERSQKYGGVSVESTESTNAVLDTSNQIVKFENRLAVVVFHRESGGQTAASTEVWPDSPDLPYLHGVSDIVGTVDFSKGGQYESWSNRASIDDLREAFNREGDTYVGRYLSTLTVLGTSDSGRVQVIDMIGEKDHVVDTMALAQALNRRIAPDFLPSNKFTMTFEDNGYRFAGSGKGSGVGMSQWGAYQRALGDQDYVQIIQAYFPGTEVSEIPTEGIEVVHNTRVDIIR